MLYFISDRWNKEPSAVCTGRVVKSVLSVNLLQVHYIDYGNTEAVPMGDVITEAVLPSLSPQAVGIKFPCLSPPSVRAEQLISLSQLIVDQNIDLIIRGKTEDSYLIASSEVIDCWMAAENCTAL